MTLTPFMVDTAWWRQEAVVRRQGSRPAICSVGQEYRDYHTLVEAVRGLEVDVTIAAASPWSRRPDAAQELDIPDNVHVTKLNQYDLRQLYADSDFVVVPVEETDFQAGITTILEAMAMELAVVCSRTSGQTDTVVDDVNGILVVPGDAAHCGTPSNGCSATGRSPIVSEQTGAWVVDHADVEGYAERLATLAGAHL